MAMREFRRVVEKYPQGNKVSDALLKVGFAHLAIGSTEAGRQTLEQLVRSYPEPGGRRPGQRQAVRAWPHRFEWRTEDRIAFGATEESP